MSRLYFCRWLFRGRKFFGTFEKRTPADTNFLAFQREVRVEKKEVRVEISSRTFYCQLLQEDAKKFSSNVSNKFCSEGN